MMTAEELRKALETAETIPPDLACDVEGIIGTIGIQGPLLPELIRRTREHLAAEGAIAKDHAAAAAHFLEAVRVSSNEALDRYKQETRQALARADAAEKALAEAVAAERAACATIVEEGMSYIVQDGIYVLAAAAAAIRARISGASSWKRSRT